MLNMKSTELKEMMRQCNTDVFKELEYLMESRVKEIANINNIAIFDVKVQLRLLFPITMIVPWSMISTDDKIVFLNDKLEETIKLYKNMLAEYCPLTGVCHLCGNEQIYHDKRNHKMYCYLSNGQIHHFFIDYVNIFDSEYIESKLHYLHSFRKDSEIHLGLFLEGYKKPIGYISLAKVDRKDKIDSLSQFVGREVKDNVYEVARTYGCKKLPFNSISIMMSYCFNLLRKKGIKYVITAINPYLGFSGESILASNFQPFALRNVIYSYSRKFDYITSRDKCKDNNYYINRTMPPNVLFVKQL